MDGGGGDMPSSRGVRLCDDGFKPECADGFSMAPGENGPSCIACADGSEVTILEGGTRGCADDIATIVEPYTCIEKTDDDQQRKGKAGKKGRKSKKDRINVCEDGFKPSCPEDTEMMKTAEGPVCLDADEVETEVECVVKEEREERARLCQKGFRPSCAEGYEMTKLEDNSKVCVSVQEEDDTTADIICIERTKGKKNSRGKDKAGDAGTDDNTDADAADGRKGGRKGNKKGGRKSGRKGNKEEGN